MQVDEFELAEESPAPPARAVHPAPSPVAARGQAAASSAAAPQLHGAATLSGSPAPGPLIEGHPLALAAHGAVHREAAVACAAAEARRAGAGAGASEPLPSDAGDVAAGPGAQPARAGLQPAMLQQRASAARGEAARAAADGEPAMGPWAQAVGASEQALGAPVQAARASLEPAALPQRRALGASRLRRTSLAAKEGACARRSSAADGAGGRCACLECSLFACKASTSLPWYA